MDLNLHLHQELFWSCFGLLLGAFFGFYEVRHKCQASKSSHCILLPKQCNSSGFILLFNPKFWIFCISLLNSYRQLSTQCIRSTPGWPLCALLFTGCLNNKDKICRRHRGMIYWILMRAPFNLTRGPSWNVRQTK